MKSKLTVKAGEKKPAPEAQLRHFISRFDPKEQKLIRAVRMAVRKRFPAANELVYDYRDSVVIGYSPTDKGIDAIVATAARSDGVRLYFTNGPRLPDPKSLLLGPGKQTRYIPVEAASRLAHPDVKALMAAATEAAAVRLPSRGKGTLIIQSAAAKKRPRRAKK